MKSKRPANASMKARSRDPVFQKSSPATPGRRVTPRIGIAVICLVAVAGACWVTSKLVRRGPKISSGAAVVSPDPSSRLPAPARMTPGDASSATKSVPISPPLPSFDTNDPVQVINRGTQLLEAGQIEEAIQLYQRATALKVDDEEAFFNLGVAYSRFATEAARAGRESEAAKHVEESKRYYREAIRLFPEYVEAHKNLGNLLINERRYDEAMASFSAAIRINPDNSSVLNSLGKCLALQGKTPEALIQFREAARLDTNSLEARFNLASACARLGKLDEAINEFEQLLKIAPDFELAARQLAKIRATKAAAGK
jgi:tetratricopeptide (TPR) repeat protein